MTAKRLVALWALACVLGTTQAAAYAGVEFNPVRDRPVAIGPQASRFIVAFRTTSDNVVTRTLRNRVKAAAVQFTEAQTTTSDAEALARRVGLASSRSRQITPGMHVLYLQTTLYGAQVQAALAALRADPAVKFADIDARRYPHSVPNDPLFTASLDSAGQWYLLPPSAASPSSDAAATDAVSAWTSTTGNTGVVIADIDTGVRFDHPDLLRAGFGGRLLPGYDFVAGDKNSSGAPLGTFLAANDGDGWDPDPSDPGDWIDAADQSSAIFPAADCAIADSSWHGTRVMGILGALTNNGVGVAGMTWNSYLLPVRALGKCGGYDSDIIAGMNWAAGLSVTGVPDNPFPADIVNLSLGASGACPAAYADAVTTLYALGVLVVASAGNEAGPVDAPGNCPGVLAVAGLRNVGTKVGYSSFGAEVGIAAPAGNCVNTSGACLKSLDTTTNTGLTAPSDASYTSEINPNLGTSFSAPIVSGVAALMRSVNANLTPTQLIARLQSSATPFPQPVGTKLCPAVNASSGECACPNDGQQCGAGMLNASNAVAAASRPIAAVAVSASGGSVLLDAGGSAAACGLRVASYAWTTTGGVAITAGAEAAQATVMPTGSSGTVTLTVTDSQGAADTAILSVTAAGIVSTTAATPSSAGNSVTACPTPLTVIPAAPTVNLAFVPSSVTENTGSTLTITLSNANAFDLTYAAMSEELPANLTLEASDASLPAGTTNCPGASLVTTASSAALSAAAIPARGSCSITLVVKSAAAGSYTASVAANALATAPAGSNAAAASATLAVTTPSKGGGGEIDWWDTMFVVGVLLAGRRHAKRRGQGGP